MHVVANAWDALLSRLLGHKETDIPTAAALTVLGVKAADGSPATATPPAQDHAALPGLDAAIRACAPMLDDADIAAWVEALSPPFCNAGIDRPRRMAAFVGQCAVESGGFRLLSENLSYSAPRLCQVWPSRFPTLAAAAPCAHNPETLANRVYANRLGNGDEASGDGWLFRGRGLIQLTGRANYARFAASVGLAVEAAADHAATRSGAAETAVWFWTDKGLNALADAWALDDITRRINGGLTAAEERRRLCNAALAVLGE